MRFVKTRIEVFRLLLVPFFKLQVVALEIGLGQSQDFLVFT
jgi:hypothetical protein